LANSSNGGGRRVLSLCQAIRVQRWKDVRHLVGQFSDSVEEEVRG
jgi:hypothetical protein